MGRAVGRMGLGLALAVVLAASGCTTWQGGVPGFLHNRAMDAMRCVDLGVTTTSEPQFSFYAALLSFAPFGYGKVDGQFTGIGGGDIGSMKVHYEHWGIVATGHEAVGWGNSMWDYPEFDPNVQDDRMDCQGVGIVGFVTPPYDGRPNGRPT